jgi:hypothetical protein
MIQDVDIRACLQQQPNDSSMSHGDCLQERRCVAKPRRSGVRSVPQQVGNEAAGAEIDGVEQKLLR